MFGYICLPNIHLSEAYLWICLEMFNVARDMSLYGFINYHDQWCINDLNYTPPPKTGNMYCWLRSGRSKYRMEHGMICCMDLSIYPMALVTYRWRSSHTICLEPFPLLESIERFHDSYILTMASFWVLMTMVLWHRLKKLGTIQRSGAPLELVTHFLFLYLICIPLTHITRDWFLSM